MTWGFWWAGVKPRKPGKYVKYREVDAEDIDIEMTADSKETIHCSVRVLSDNGSDKRGRFLTDYTLNGSAPYIWHLSQLPHIPEAIPREFELGMIEEWLKEEKGRFGDEAGLRLLKALPVVRIGPTEAVRSAATL
jgi:hypothetical protein